MRDACIRLFYESYPRAMTLQQYEDVVAWWDFQPIMVNDDLAGAVMMLGNEIHIHVKPEYHGKWAIRRDMAKRFLQDRIDAYGPIIVTMLRDNEQALRFVQRLGFKKREQDEHTITMVLEQCRYVRS